MFINCSPWVGSDMLLNQNRSSVSHARGHQVCQSITDSGNVPYKNGRQLILAVPHNDGRQLIKNAKLCPVSHYRDELIFLKKYGHKSLILNPILTISLKKGKLRVSAWVDAGWLG